MKIFIIILFQVCEISQVEEELGQAKVSEEAARAELAVVQANLARCDEQITRCMSNIRFVLSLYILLDLNSNLKLIYERKLTILMYIK